MSDRRPEPGPARADGPFARRSASTLSEQLIHALLFGCAALSILTTVGIVAVLAFETVKFFGEVSFAEFFGETQWTPLFADKHFGIWPLVAGTLLTTTIAVAVALPLGLLAAIYLSELATPRVRAWVKPALEILAGVPTIVYGFFALVVVTPLLRQVLPELGAFNALSAGIVMGIMIMPMIASLSEDALYAVPVSLREGAYGLGASKLRTIFGVVLPAAFSGIAASVVLAISRAIGETMIVAIAAGQQPNLTADPTEPVMTMTAYIVQVSMGDVPTGTLEHKTIFAVGATLFLMTFGMNMLSQALTARFRGKQR